MFIPVQSLGPRVQERPTQTQMHVALVCMPWGSVQKPPLALSLLRECVLKMGHVPHLQYLNIRFAKRIGLSTYEKIADRAFLHSEWFFARRLFGPSGLGEIANDWEDVKSRPDPVSLADILCSMTDGSAEVCREIAETHVEPFIQECLDSIDWGKFQVVGFTTTFAQSLSSLLLAREIKQRYPAVQIVFGGANVDSEMGVEYLRGFEWVDYVVHGEAEQSFAQLLQVIADGSHTQTKISGVSMRMAGRVVPGHQDSVPTVNINEAGPPDYSAYITQLEEAGLRKRVELRLYFESSRGCWWGEKHHCTFCGLNGSSIKFRKKDAARVFTDIVELATKYECLQLSATDNIISNSFFFELLKDLENLNTDIKLFYEVKANLSREQIRLLRDAGVCNIQPGIESLNSRLLKLMDKGITAIQNIQLLKWCFEYNVDPSWNLLYGFPGETSVDYHDLLTIVQGIAHLRPPGIVNQVIFERFSPYYFNPDKYGLSLRPWEVYSFIFPENRVDIRKIAYFFDGSWTGEDPATEEFIEPVRRFCDRWSEWWKTRVVYCRYERGPNYVVIYDNRPRPGREELRERRITLRGRIASVYGFCDENRSFKSIAAHVGEQPESGSAAELRRSLDQLVASGLMFREGERYLSLAVRNRGSKALQN